MMPWLSQVTLPVFSLYFDSQDFRADIGTLLRTSIFSPRGPLSQVTEDYLAWVCERLRADGKTALMVVWDNASGHVSQRVRAWIKAHNRTARQAGGVRIVACFLPIKSPLLNPIEPKWAYGKKAIVEPDRLLTADEVRDRVRACYGCDTEPPLVQQTGKKVA